MVNEALKEAIEIVKVALGAPSNSNCSTGMALINDPKTAEKVAASIETLYNKIKSLE